MTRFLVDKRWRAIVAWFCLIAVCGTLAVSRTPIETQISQLLPRTEATAQLLDDFSSSIAARMIMIGIEGSDERATAAASTRLAHELQASGAFARVLNGPSSLAKTEIDQLFAYRYALSPSVVADRFTADSLRQALRQRLSELNSPLAAVVKEFLPSDPTGEFRTILVLLQGELHQPQTRSGVWFSHDGKTALLLAETRASGFDVNEQKPAVAAVRRAFDAARADVALADAHLSLAMSGPAVLAVLSEETIRREAGLLGAASLGAIIVLLILAYRSPRVILVCPVPMLSAVVVAIAVVGVLYGGLQGIVLGFGATLMGVAVDYPVLLFSHLRRETSVETTIQRLWPTLRLCVLSAAVAYLAMTATSVAGLSQLSTFSIAGLVTAAIITRWVVPALLPTHWAPVTNLDRLPTMPAMVRHLRPGPVITTATVLLAALAAGTVVAPPRWQSDLAALSPIPAPILAQDARLRRELGAPEAGQLLLIRAATPEAVLDRSEDLVRRLRDLVAAGHLTGFDAPSLYLPSQFTQRQRRAALPDEATLRANLAEASAGLPFRAQLFESFIDAVQRARVAPAVGIDDLRHTPLGIKLGALLYPRGDGWSGLVLLSGVRDPAAIAAAVADAGYPRVTYVDFRSLTSRLMSEFRDRALQSASWGAVVLVIALTIGVRSWRRAAVVLLPVALAVLVDLNLFALRGEPLTLFHVVSLLLVVGLGIDYGLFFSRVTGEADERRRTLHALLVCSSSTVAGFGVLCFSSLPVLTSIGQTVTLGVVTAFVFAAIIARPWAASQLPERGGFR